MIEIDLNKIGKNELATLLIEKDKEIERLKESEEFYKKGFAELYKRIEKANEYIEEHKRTYENDEYCFDNMIEDVTPLLNILKGSDKE